MKKLLLSALLTIVAPLLAFAQETPEATSAFWKDPFADPLMPALFGVCFRANRHDFGFCCGCLYAAHIEHVR
ncbi:MAG: hypothetical protein HC859_10155 [Bacteroidia bacterium]|nr:hypothetical protein [Bacteroidia bacterium]